jgi:hypothetical protein
LLERGDEWRHLGLPDSVPLHGRQTVDLTLDIEDRAIRRTASMAKGALASSASLNRLRRPWLQHAASVIGAGLRSDPTI